MELLKAIGKKIQILREKRGMTQDELANLSEINPKYVSAIERGQRNVTISTLEKIANGLGVECYELLICPEDKEPKQVLRKAIEALLQESEQRTLQHCFHFLRIAQE